MPRALKPHVMETIRHKNTRETCDLMIDRNRKIFFADYMGEHFEHAEAAKVVAWIRAALDAGIKIEWVPVLSVSFSRDDLKDKRDQGYEPPTKPAAVILALKRFYIGVLRDGTIKQSDWDVLWRGDPGESENKIRTDHMKHCSIRYTVESGRAVLPHSSTGGGNSWSDTDRSITIDLPYSESMWVGLVHMQDAIRHLGQQIEAMIAGEDGQRQIASRGDELIKALPAPAPKPEPESAAIEPVKRKIENVHFSIDPSVAQMLWLSGTPIEDLIADDSDTE